MRTFCIQYFIKANSVVILRILSFFLILFSIPVSAQITLTSDDMYKMYTLGYSTRVHEYDGSASVDIGHSGGGNNWDFSGLSENLHYNLFSVDKSTAPNPQEFPGTDIVLYSDGGYQGQLGEIWSYYSLNGSFENLGAAVKLAVQPGKLASIKNNPARIDAEFPLTYNSSWSGSYNQSISVDGMSGLQTPISLNVTVDAYGTMKLPGGETYEALRMRQTMTITTILGDSTSVTYFFLSKGGAHVSLNAPTGVNLPDSGLINVENYSWNDSLANRNSSFIADGLLGIYKPSKDEIVIAGEKDTIKYVHQTGNINIYYTTDRGNGFVPIVSDYSSDDNQYIWDVPETLLTRRAYLKIVDSEDTLSFFHKIAYSQIFKIKPWQLTRVDENGEFELFEPDQDGWAFCNCGRNIWPKTWWQQFDYQNGTDPFTGTSYPNKTPFDSAKSSKFTDWPLFVNTFGISQCYNSVSNASYNSRALTKWFSYQTNWNGSCYGFSVSSLLYFYEKPVFLRDYPGLDDAQSLSWVPLNDSSRKIINLFQLLQFGKTERSYHNSKWKNVDARQTLQELKDLFAQDNISGEVLSFYNNNGSGGHAVVPYKLERIGNTSAFDLRVYNSNAPGSSNSIIFIDSSANTWTDSTGLNWGTGTYRCILNLYDEVYFRTPQFSKLNSMKWTTKPDVQSLRNEIYNTSDADINISGSGKTIGYEDSLVVNTMEDAIPIIPLTGYSHPPIGYSLPVGNYSVEISNFKNSSPYVFFMTESTIYNYRRFDAESDETDEINFSDGIGIKNPDVSVKNINIQTIIDEQNSEKDFEVNNIEIPKDDSINIKEKNRNDLLVNNYGGGKNYDLHLRNASADGDKIYFHSNVPLASNSSHQIIPAWNDIENSKVKILIDNGNDGTIDDSMLISNEITEIKDRYSSSVPKTFTLYQNYPNPFNPSTTIKYDIPNQAHVTLIVYNILGEEVAVLVNGEKQPGSYDVKFDGGRLSSGIYFYSIQTENKIITKKMILLK